MSIWGGDLIVHNHRTQIIGLGNQLHLMGQGFDIFVFVEDEATTTLNWYIDNKSKVCMDFKPSRLGNHILSVQCSWMTISVQWNWKIVEDFMVMNVPTTNATHVITINKSTCINKYTRLSYLEYRDNSTITEKIL